MYANGKGVPENPVYAYAWGNIAAAQGIMKARKLKEYATDRMDPVSGRRGAGARPGVLDALRGPFPVGPVITNGIVSPTNWNNLDLVGGRLFRTLLCHGNVEISQTPPWETVLSGPGVAKRQVFLNASAIGDSARRDECRGDRFWLAQQGIVLKHEASRSKTGCIRVCGGECHGDRNGPVQ